MELLKFFTAGNVDDGKSTLIGRLLFDSGSVSTDIIETLTKQSKTSGEDTRIDLALLTDGLRAEREQGITIDVAYKYFTTAKRKFIIADTPGHAQYTRNMFTGASTADLAIILVDARRGITAQTKRHSIVCSILGLKEVIVCVNKMDLIDFSEEKYNSIVSEYQSFAQKLKIKNVRFIPVSALSGDNVVQRSANMNWYKGAPLLEILETTEISVADIKEEARFTVQYVIRPQTESLHDYRGYAGHLLSGELHKGQKIKIQPSGFETEITKIEKHQIEVDSAGANEPLVIHLKDDLDVSRGDSIVAASYSGKTENELNAVLCWMDDEAYRSGQRFLLLQNSFSTKALISKVEAYVDVETLEEVAPEKEFSLNTFGKIKIRTANPIAFDPYDKNKKTGSFILVNENTYNTVAAGVILN